jgi:hypothetical protein
MEVAYGRWADQEMHRLYGVQNFIVLFARVHHLPCSEPDESSALSNFLFARFVLHDPSMPKSLTEAKCYYSGFLF